MAKNNSTPSATAESAGAKDVSFSFVNRLGAPERACARPSLMEQNPTLMRLRETEALEKVAEKGRLSVVVGEGGLAARVEKLV